MTFKALIVVKSADGAISAAVNQVGDDRLPADGNVTVTIEYSTLNYKDGLCITGTGGLVRTFPHVPGIDFAGTVETSSDLRTTPSMRCRRRIPRKFSCARRWRWSRMRRAARR